MEQKRVSKDKESVPFIGGGSMVGYRCTTPKYDTVESVPFERGYEGIQSITRD
jgi:hypothetical protein